MIMVITDSMSSNILGSNCLKVINIQVSSLKQTQQFALLFEFVLPIKTTKVPYHCQYNLDTGGSKCLTAFNAQTWSVINQNTDLRLQYLHHRLTGYKISHAGHGKIFKQLAHQFL